MIPMMFRQWMVEHNVSLPRLDTRDIIDEISARLPIVHGYTMRPVPDSLFVEKNGIRRINTYVPPQFNRLDNFEVPLILKQYLERLLPDQRDRKTVVQFLAHLVQRPWVRPHWGLIITGDGGTGKSLLAQVARLALGGQHFHSGNDYACLTDKFSEVLPNNLLVVFDDANERLSTYDRLKFFMTTGHVQVPVKFVQLPVEREVYARLILVSNKQWPLVLEQDRRFYVTERCIHMANKTESAEFFDRFGPWLEEANTACILHNWLINVDLSDFDSYRPVITAAHERMENRESLELIDIVQEFAGKWRNFHLQTFVQYLKQRGQVFLDVKLVEELLVKVGMKGKRRANPIRDERPSSPKQIRLWSSANARRSSSLTGGEVEALRLIPEGLL